jgi:oligopeptide/dipeptide ABC transporter ATP-binding protein
MRQLRSPLAATAAFLVGVVLLLAVLGPVIWGSAADRVDTARIGAGPSGAHWAGTDGLGRDILARTLVATRLSIGLALAATVIMVLLGLLLGAAPMLLGGRAGRLVTAAVNLAVAFPGLLLALFFAVVFGVGATGAMLAIGVAGAPGFARLTHTLVAGVESRDYVSAARVAGVGRWRILVRHVLPNVAEPLVVNATIGAGAALLSFAGLSFLGLGVQQPSYDWGRLLSEGLANLYVNPASALIPGAAVLIAGLAFNLLGETVAGAVGSERVVLLPTGLRAPAKNAAARENSERPVLEVDGLEVTLPTAHGPVRPVRGVSFSVARGEALGIVGESGSGKSMTALAIACLTPDTGRVQARSLRLLGQDLHDGDEQARRRLLGTALAMVFQDPMTSFNPTRRMGRQLAEVAVHHQGLSRTQALARAVDRLDAVRIPDPGHRAGQYPHEFSGGMRQRAMIGMGLMGSPSLIIADEPTTALDVTVQQQVLDLLATIRRSDDVALILISHDVTVVGEVCDRVLVMYAGQVVEDLPAGALSGGAWHPYTQALVAAVPGMDADLDLPLPVVPGRPADLADLPPGCSFAPRCPLADDHCRAEEPPLLTIDRGRRVACWHAGEPIEPQALRLPAADDPESDLEITDELADLR